MGNRKGGTTLTTAIADTAFVKAVADHKSIFFAEKSRHGELIDYHGAVSGRLQLVPDDGALATLASHHQHMVDDGLFLDNAEPFDALPQRCRVILARDAAKTSQTLAAARSKSANQCAVAYIKSH
jgi:hypothetical protein